MRLIFAPLPAQCPRPSTSKSFSVDLGHIGLLWTIADHNREYKPVAEKCTLHSGSCFKNVSPSAPAHVSARSRSNAAVTAKQEAKKRVLEEKTAAEVASPRKKVSIARRADPHCRKLQALSKELEEKQGRGSL